MIHGYLHPTSAEQVCVGKGIEYQCPETNNTAKENFTVSCFSSMIHWQCICQMKPMASRLKIGDNLKVSSTLHADLQYKGKVL